MPISIMYEQYTISLNFEVSLYFMLLVPIFYYSQNTEVNGSETLSRKLPRKLLQISKVVRCSTLLLFKNFFLISNITDYLFLSENQECGVTSATSELALTLMLHTELKCGIK